MGAKLRVPSFHQDFGPSFDGVTVKDDDSPGGGGIKGRRSFGTRCVHACTIRTFPGCVKFTQPGKVPLVQSCSLAALCQWVERLCE